MISRPLELTMIVVGFIIDLCVLVAGLQVIGAPPMSILASVQHPFGFLITVWALLLVLGGVAAILGSVIIRTPRLYAVGFTSLVGGSFASAAGLAVWAIAIYAQPGDPTPAGEAVAAALYAGSMALVWRCLGVYAGRQIRRTR